MFERPWLVFWVHYRHEIWLFLWHANQYSSMPLFGLQRATISSQRSLKHDEFVLRFALSKFKINILLCASVSSNFAVGLTALMLVSEPMNRLTVLMRI